MFELFTYIVWFALGTFFGIVCTLTFVEYANARTIEDICKNMEND